MIRVRTPNPEFNGVRLGVEFRNGVASVETLTPEQIQRFVGWGYVLEAPDVPTAIESHVEPLEQAAPSKTTGAAKPPAKTASKTARRPKPTAQRKR